MSELKALAVFITVGVLVICSLTVGIMMGVKQIEKSTCSAFSHESNRETKFVTYNFFQWDCLTPTKDGKWISTSRLRDID